MARVLIGDGYTIDGRFPGKGYVPPVDFKFRPALPEVVYGFLRSKRDTGKEAIKATTDILIAHLVSWDVEDKDGSPVEITAANLKQTPQPLLEFMLDCVCGYEKPREDAEKN